MRQRGWNEIAVYCDDGYSGTNFDRPGVKRLIEDAKAKKINLILVKDMSRFGRNYLEVGFYIEILFPKKQIRFVAINNSVDSDKPQDNDFTPFLSIMNEWYAAQTSKKIRAVWKNKAANGKRVSSSVPFGYVRNPQYTDPYAWEQKTVAGILVNQQYTGCTVNFMTTTVSYKVHKTVYKPKDEWQIIPNT